MDQFNTSASKLENEIDPSGFGSIRTSLGFCAMGLVAALLVVPLMSEEPKVANQVASADATMEGNFDRITTGAVSTESAKKRYTIRNSVLQRDPKVACIIHQNGTREGGC